MFATNTYKSALCTTLAEIQAGSIRFGKKNQWNQRLSVDFERKIPAKIRSKIRTCEEQ
jgi:hypothetical protein